MQTGSVDLLVNASATGGYQYWAGGKGVLSVVGTFGGATLQLEMLGPNGTTPIAIPTASFTANGAIVVELPPSRLRMTVTGGTPSGLFASLQAIPE